jgi:uncharacterized protein (DUF2141 family)
MMRRYENVLETSLAIAAPLYVSALTAAGAADLTVTVSGIRNASGSVSAGVYNSATSFTKPSEALVLIRIKATQGSVGFTVHDLPPGQYAVAAYHDENGNGRLDFDPTGAPAEGYGVSNNARNPVAPPEFAKAAFELRDQNKSITVNLDY